MNTQHLKYAIEVGKTGSITQAAENLYIGQPSLSKALKELEESLGIAIFKRTNKGAVPTVQGERFLIYAREVLRQVERMEKLASTEQLEAQAFHISVPRVSYIFRAAMTLLRGMNSGSGMDVRILQCSAIRGIQHVSEGTSEIAVIRYPVRYERYFLDYLAEKRLRSDLIWEGEPEILLPEGHPLCGMSRISHEDMRKYPLIWFEDEKVPYLAFEETEENGNAGRVVVSDIFGMLEAMRAIPNAYAVSAGFEAENEGLIRRRIDCLGRVRDVIVYPNDYVFRPMDRDLINQIAVEKNNMLYGDNKTLEIE